MIAARGLGQPSNEQTPLFQCLEDFGNLMNEREYGGDSQTPDLTQSTSSQSDNVFQSSPFGDLELYSTQPGDEISNCSFQPIIWDDLELDDMLLQERLDDQLFRLLSPEDLEFSIAQPTKPNDYVSSTFRPIELEPDDRQSEDVVDIASEVALQEMVPPEVHASEQEESSTSMPSINDEEAVFVPERLIAERKTDDGLQYLIQWENYPDEKDWTWEPQDIILQDVPDLVMTWRMKQEEPELEEEADIAVEYVPEKILGKRKFKNVPHYLVQWKGFPQKEDRTWEPCDRLSVDVPLLVENFEARRKNR